MNKKSLTLKDLYDFYVNNFSANVVFDRKENEDKPIVVQAENIASFEKNTTQDGLMYLTFRVCHTDVNRNGSRISEETMEKAMPSLKNRPVLAYIKEDKNGELDFDGHNMRLDNDGNIIYEESQVGSFTEEDPYLEYDEKAGKSYVIARAAIPVDYTKTSEILERRGGTDVSCELYINQMSYDANDKVLDLTDFYFSACTLLGADVKPGMEGARAEVESLKDFSKENNGITFSCEADFIKELSTLKNMIKDVSDKIDLQMEKGGNENLKLSELLEKYSVTEEDLNFEYQNLSDEELEKKFEEQFTTTPESQNKIIVNGKEYVFEVSLDEKQRALEILVNDTYEDEDSYYRVKVYDGYLVMIDFWSDKAYRQDYQQEEDSFSLTGERVEVKCHYLTKEEEDALEEMKQNYSNLEEKVKDFETKENNAKKQEIYDSEDFELIRNVEEFQKLKDNFDNYSVEEFQKACDDMLLDFVKEHKNYSLSGRRGIRIGAEKEEAYSPYGSLFKK